MKLISILLACLPLFAADGLNTLTAEEKKASWLLLFNGRDLDGWDGAPGLWSVENGAIVACTDKKQIKENTFLIYRKANFADLILRADVRLRNAIAEFSSAARFCATG